MQNTMQNNFNAIFYVGDVDVTVQFTFNNATGWRAVAIAANNKDWEMHTMQAFNELVLNKFNCEHLHCQQQFVVQNLLHVVSVYEPELDMQYA